MMEADAAAKAVRGTAGAVGASVAGGEFSPAECRSQALDAAPQSDV
jgi:hypothetical protein